MSYCEQSKELFLRARQHVIVVTFILAAYKIFNLDFSGLLRSILGNLGAPRHVRLLTYAKCAIHGLEKQPKLESGMSKSTKLILTAVIMILS